jgi:hypothetical protein
MPARAAAGLVYGRLVLDESRSERDAYDDALVARFVDLSVPGASWEPVLPRRGPPPDYLVQHAGARIGVELTEVLTERVPDDINALTVTGPRRMSDTETGSKALHQQSVRRHIMHAAESRYTGPPAIVSPAWSIWNSVTDSDVQRLANALGDVVAAITTRAPVGEAALGWQELARTPLVDYVNTLRLRWGGRITRPMWASGFAVSEVTPDAIKRTIRHKETKFDKWCVSVRHRWLLLTLSLESERLLDSPGEPAYETAFDRVYCCDARLRFVRLTLQPGEGG